MPFGSWVFRRVLAALPWKREYAGQLLTANRGCGALLNDQFSGSLNRLHCLVIDTFHWRDLDVGSICSLGNGQRIVLIGIMSLPEWSHSYSGNYLHLMTVRCCQTSPVVGSSAGLKREQIWLLLGQELRKFYACQLLVRQFFIGRRDDSNLDSIMRLRDPIDSRCESVAMVNYHLRLVERHHSSAGLKDTVTGTAVLVFVFCYFR